MYERERDGRREVAVTDIEALVPENHLVRKIEKVMDYEWIYERVAPYYSAAKHVRSGTDSVVLEKMVLLQHLFGIPSLRQTYQRACDTISYRWFLGYGLLDKLPHFATVSYAFCRRFPEELATEIFEHILNKALNNHMGVCPKICVNTIIGANRAILIQGGSRGIRLPSCLQHNAGGAGCQGRRSRLITLDIRARRCYSGMRSAK